MSNRHYWPTEQGDRNTTYLVEHQNGEMLLMHLGSDGSWSSADLFRHVTTDSLAQNGYLGVRTTFSEEAERAVFLSYMKFPVDVLPVMVNALFQIWLAAKRHERGL